MCVAYVLGFANVIYLFGFANGWLTALYPSVHGIMGAHNIESLAQAFPYFFTNRVPYLTTAFSAVYSSVLITVIFAVGLITIDKHDFLN